MLVGNRDPAGAITQECRFCTLYIEMPDPDGRGEEKSYFIRKLHFIYICEPINADFCTLLQILLALYNQLWL